MTVERIRVCFVGGPLNGVVEQELNGLHGVSHVTIAYLLYKDDPTLACKWFIVADGDAPDRMADITSRGTTPHYYKVAKARQAGVLLELTCEYGGTEHPTDHSHG